jgi:hypothetical protein
MLPSMPPASATAVSLPTSTLQSPQTPTSSGITGHIVFCYPFSQSAAQVTFVFFCRLIDYFVSTVGTPIFIVCSVTK